ncbi:alpha/beta fold hydrolase [Streptomyces sp. NPDC057403]|uniref:alpha/beta fold hydrolase n=1 Tax=Streptomyces sp. NPDC057403 TaxID=3346119 RepID=UPI00368D381A
MPAFAAPDGTRLAYHVFGDEGPPVVCLPGGPLQASAYLGELGGLSARRRLVLLDFRGTGDSALPKDPATFRCDRLVDDVEALRAHLGLETMDLLGHSAGTNPAVLYAARHPRRVDRLALITPSAVAVGLGVAPQVRRDTARSREAEPWFPTAFAALQAITTGRATAADWEAISPFLYGRWDDTARAHHAAGAAQRNQEAAAVFGAEGAFDPAATRAALAGLAAPVLLLAGEVDLNSPAPMVAEFAGLFAKAESVVQPGAGHFPWLDDPERFVATVGAFLE